VPPPPQPFRLILASASPRRRELLTQAGFLFDIEAADIDETLRPNEHPAAYVSRLATEKAAAILARHSPSVTHPAAHTPGALVVLGADTTVVCDDHILAKPADPADAARMLRLLSGRTHQVLTGLAVARFGQTTGTAHTISVVESTDVTFSPIPELELAAYIATAEPLDKAGAYGIQGYAARWVPRIDGCYFNVMGLPIARTVALLRAALAG
jgi:septum formation protein